MNVRTLVHRDGATWEITWLDREVETYLEGSDGAHTESRCFSSDADADAWVQQAIEERLAAGFAVGVPARRAARTAHPIVAHARSQPDDDQARQVLLDWLLEQGDPLASLAARWRGSRDPAQRRAVAEQLHATVFSGWRPSEVGAAWDLGFLTHLQLRVVAPRQLTIAARVSDLFARPITWLLRSLELDARCEWIGTEIEEEQPISYAESEPMLDVVQHIAANGPQPAVEALILRYEHPDTLVDPTVLAGVVPGVRRLVVDAGGLRDLFPLPEAWAGQLEVLELPRVAPGGPGWDELVGMVQGGRLPRLRQLSVHRSGAEALPVALGTPGLAIVEPTPLTMPYASVRFDGIEAPRQEVSQPADAGGWDQQLHYFDWDPDEMTELLEELTIEQRGGRGPVSPDEWFDQDGECAVDPWGGEDPQDEPWDLSISRIQRRIG